MGKNLSIIGFGISSIYLLGLPLFGFAQEASTGTPFQSIGTGFIKIPKLLQGVSGPAGATTFGGIVIQVLSIVLLIVGSIAVISLIWGGFRYMTAYGNEEAAESAKRIIKNAILGLIIVLFSFAMISIITNALVTGQIRAGP